MMLIEISVLIIKATGTELVSGHTLQSLGGRVFEKQLRTMEKKQVPTRSNLQSARGSNRKPVTSPTPHVRDTSTNASMTLNSVENTWPIFQ